MNTDGWVRPVVTAALVGAIIWMAIVQADDASRAAVVTLGVSIASFWFGAREGAKAAEAAGKAVATPPSSPPVPEATK